MSVDAVLSTESLPPTRQMRLKVLYTFDNAQQTTCLARASSVYTVHVVHCPPSSPSSSAASSSSHSLLGVIDLRSCLSAVASASPELVSDPESDYAVYTVDYSERDAPLVGHGLLSWALSAPGSAEDKPIGAEITGSGSSTSGGCGGGEGLQQMVCGRVCSNMLAVFGGGVRETLEIKLRLSPVAGVSQLRYIRSMQLYVRLSRLLPGSFDPSVWSNFIASNPQVMQLLTAPAYATAASSDAANTASSVVRDKTDFDAFLGLPSNLPSELLADVGNNAPKRARPRPSNGTAKKSRQPLDDLASSALNIANNTNPHANVSARKPRSSSSRPRKPRTQSARATPAAASDAITSVVDDENDSHTQQPEQSRTQGPTSRSNASQQLTGAQPLSPLSRNPSSLPQRQALVRATTAPTPSTFSPPSSICSTNSPYVESPQLASSPPVSGANDRLSPYLEGPIPKAWTLDFDDKAGVSHVQHAGTAASTSPTTAAFDELMSATLNLDDPDVFLRTTDHDASISLANDFVREFYRFESESEESSAGGLNASTGDGGISTDVDMTDAIEAQAIEALVMETHNAQQRLLASREKSESTSSTGASDGFDEEPMQKISPITSPAVAEKEGSRARSTTPKIDKLESDTATKAKSRVSAKIKERIHESLIQDLAAGKVPRYCENCGDIKTSTWRKIRAMTVNNKMEDMWLCNPCGLYFASKKLMRPQHLWRDDSVPLSSDAFEIDVASETVPAQASTPSTLKFGPTTPGAAVVAGMATTGDITETKKRKVGELQREAEAVGEIVEVQSES
ncbi:hypothetical protein V1517DRAFT_327242 [Lipomyces orientalis]|uniref:Uncharacterized protein n=1 Tax=Lipomyces orientalis TaxID=1233043 RepID=A0ACC3TJ80_9ASCO